MNFYPFFIGDYAGATRHLTWDEDMAYRRMLDVYYSREAPLPLDRRQIYRLVGATEKRQRQAVDTVLTEFFEDGEHGWHNVRADQEIAKASEKTMERAAKKENEAERQRRHRERRKALFEQLRGHGVVPPYETTTATLEEMVTSRGSHAPVTRDVTQTQRLTNTNTNTNTNISSLVVLGRDPDFDLEVKLREAAGWQSEPAPKLCVTGEIQALIDAGADLELDVLPIIRSIAPRVNPTSWSYFVKPIAEQRDRRIAAATVVSIPSANPARSRANGTHRKPSRDETFAAIDRRIEQLAEAERRTAAGGPTGHGEPDEGAA